MSESPVNGKVYCSIRASIDKAKKIKNIEFVTGAQRTALVRCRGKMPVFGRAQAFSGAIAHKCGWPFRGHCGIKSDMPNDSIDQLARRLAESLPDSIRSLGDDLEKNFRSVLQSGLSKLDLVTREEFEVQEAVLQRTREMLEAMEGRLAELETSIARPAKPAKKTAKKKKAAKKKS